MSKPDYKNDYNTLINILESSIKENSDNRHLIFPEPKKEGIIFKAVGKEILKEIVFDYLNLLETSGAVYEKNGDYAIGLFSSEWCQLMNSSDNSNVEFDSQKDNCGKLCLECTSKPTGECRKTIDIECSGGIRLYIVPIIVNNESVGTINLGYGRPPNDEYELKKLSRKFNLPFIQLKEAALSYVDRPDIIIEMAKRKVDLAAKYIGAFVSMYMNEQDKIHSLEEIEKFHDILIGREERIIELKETVNILAAELGRKEPFDLSFVDN